MNNQKRDEANWVLDRYKAMKAEFDAYEWPRLTPVTIEEDGDEVTALRCPWCEADLLPGGGLHAVDYAERWTYIGGESNFEEGELALYADTAEFGDTLHYEHDGCDKPVSLPEGWTEDWK